MAIIRHFGKKYKVVVKFLGVNLVFEQNFDLSLAKCAAFGQVFIVVDGQIILNDLSIWSHRIETITIPFWTLSTEKEKSVIIFTQRL